MNRFILIFVLAALAFASSDEDAPAGKLLLAIDFGSGAVTSVTGETWLGLFPAAKGYELRKCTITVTPVFDQDMDKKDGPLTGKRVTTDQPQAPVFLLSGIEGLKEGPVKSYFSDKPMYLFPGQTFTSPGPIYEERLMAFGTYEGATEEEHVNPRTYKLMVFADSWDARKRQVLFEGGGFNDAHPTLIWAGDLDGDGKTDYFMNLTKHYAGAHYTLFLSSRATESEVVHLVAKLDVAWC